MTAQTADRKRPQLGDRPVVEFLDVPIAASTLIYNGSLVALDASGNAVRASATAGLRVVGVSQDHVDNTAGLAGAKTVRVRRGGFGFANAGAPDAFTAADVGRPAFALDDQTVGSRELAGTRPFAGRVLEIGDDGLVYVEVGPTRDGGVDIYVLAGETLTSDQYKAVKLNTTSPAAVVKSGAGERSVGILQNAPANGAMAVVRVLGETRAQADGTGVTAGDPISSGAAGVLRATTNAATGLGCTDTTAGSDSATTPLKAAHILGIAMETAAASAVFGLALTHHGVAATTAV